MKIYTRTGDAGQTSLRWGERVSKDALRVEAYGTVDEANAFIGSALAVLPHSAPDLTAMLTRIQREMFDVGADLAVPPNKDKGEQPKVTAEMVTALEQNIDQLEAGLDPLRTFILPGGTPAAAALHTARTVARRAERRLVTLMATEPADEVLLQYLNRLSDFLFVAARAANRLEGRDDIKVEWKKS
ncbi:MAG: putative cobalamin adenosyltransferase [Symbiobacteriaceae bacterium]|jgi:cob(I)alamin adenosyltransferase|nr:putative cobalamin adenosyltransferase [Symbiobacteriaceae bacterium]